MGILYIHTHTAGGNSRKRQSAGWEFHPKEVTSGHAMEKLGWSCFFLVSLSGPLWALPVVSSREIAYWISGKISFGRLSLGNTESYFAVGKITSRSSLVLLLLKAQYVSKFGDQKVNSRII